MSALKPLTLKQRLEATQDDLVRSVKAVTLRDICLTALLRDEFAWTEKFTARNGAWFQMGVARADGAHGGVLLARDYYPTNSKPCQNAYWAESFIRETGELMLHRPGDEEGLVWRECFFAVRELYWKKVREAGHVDDAAAPS